MINLINKPHKLFWRIIRSADFECSFSRINYFIIVNQCYQSVTEMKNQSWRSVAKEEMVRVLWRVLEYDSHTEPTRTMSITVVSAEVNLNVHKGKNQVPEIQHTDGQALGEM